MFDFFGKDKPPRANRFRLGDTWVGPEGRNYVIKEGKGDDTVSLQSLGWNLSMERRSRDIHGFQRIKWGGQR
jgi:hypothetical protein